MARRPSNSGDTMVVYQCWPSPVSSMCSQLRLAAMMFLISSAVMSTPQKLKKSGTKFVAGAQQRDSHRAHHGQRNADHPQAQPRRHIADTKTAVTKTINHVEKWIEVAHGLPERWQ